jgi:hypothetical protein
MYQLAMLAIFVVLIIGTEIASAISKGSREKDRTIKAQQDTIEAYKAQERPE